MFYKNCLVIFVKSLKEMYRMCCKCMLDIVIVHTGNKRFYVVVVQHLSRQDTWLLLRSPYNY